MRLEDVRAKGTYKEVVPHPGQSDRVRTYFRSEKQSPAQARSTFLLHRLANLLFPGVLPAAYEFGSDPNDGRSYMDVERVELDEKHLRRRPRRTTTVESDVNNHERAFYDKRYDETVADRKRIAGDLKAAGFRAEPQLKNWTLAGNRMIYLDMSPAWRPAKGGVIDINFDRKKLEAKIDSLADEHIKVRSRELLNELVDLVSAETNKKI